VTLDRISICYTKTPDDPFDTLDESEFYQSMEARWLPTTIDRSRWDQVRLQLWHQDERVEAGVPSSQGLTFAASRLVNDFWMPFVIGGISDGEASIYEKDLIAGVGFGFNTVHRAARDVLAFAVGWGEPADDSLQEQYTSEVFYRFQLVPNLAITPSVQYIINPSYNQEETEVWVAGIRGRLTF
jgi:porin